jgi:excisionase family DNA binding protein
MVVGSWTDGVQKKGGANGHRQPRLPEQGVPDLGPPERAAPQIEGFLTPAEVAAVLHVDPNTVARWSNEGKLASIRTPGGHRRYPISEVIRLARGTPAVGRRNGHPQPAPVRSDP